MFDNNYTIINNKLFICLENQGVVIIDINDPFNRRYIANTWYDDIYITN